VLSQLPEASTGRPSGPAPKATEATPRVSAPGAPG
jgi:hypothetical protein